jgi:hypothetical protein
MDHNEAAQQMITEKYLLNELSPEQRDQFEEHFFECSDCANDVRAGSLLLEKTKLVLGERPALVQAKSPTAKAEKKGWLSWLQPAFSLPVIIVLLGIIGYQNLGYQNLGQRGGPRVLASAVINVGSRGEKIVSIREGEPFVLVVNFPPQAEYSSYSAALQDRSGKALWSVPITPEAGRTSYPIQAFPSHLAQGNYTLVLNGLMTNGAVSKVGQSTFELQIQK